MGNAWCPSTGADLHGVRVEDVKSRAKSVRAREYPTIVKNALGKL
jgi:hypothetical protein